MKAIDITMAPVSLGTVVPAEVAHPWRRSISEQPRN